MTTLTIVPLGLPAAHPARAATAAGLVAVWQRLLDTRALRARRLAWARAELLRRADEHDAGAPSYAADLRQAALGDTTR